MVFLLYILWVLNINLNFCFLLLLNVVEYKCMILYENSLIIKYEDFSKFKI